MTALHEDARAGSGELYDLFRRNFPYAVREEATARRILADPANRVRALRDETGRLAAAAVRRDGAVLLLAVDEAFRRRGLGSALLAWAERGAAASGCAEMAVGAGADYLTPGVPTSKRWYPAVNEALYPGLDDAASRFFEKRGYRHSWDCNCFDMRFPLGDAPVVGWRSGDTVGGLVYRWAGPADRAAVCDCVEDAWPDFTRYYRDESLYDPDPRRRVLIAAEGEKTVAGALTVCLEAEGPGLGSVGATAVRPAFRGRHVAVNMTTFSAGALKEAGMREAFLGYTYSGLDHMYGYAGYKICAYYMMARKTLGPETA